MADCNALVEFEVVSAGIYIYMFSCYKHIYIATEIYSEKTEMDISYFCK
jgi:hypothetical protein